MRTFFAEFKKFALRGNVMDLAIGVVIGTAFNNIITSLVANIITPPLGLLTGKIDFKDLVANLGGTVEIKYGLFLQSVIDFILVAFALFLLIRFVNRLEHVARREQAEGKVPPAQKTPELVVLEEIRDSLKGRQEASHYPSS